jgi:hypothetical protein
MNRHLEAARQAREDFEMKILGGPIAEISKVHDPERVARDFDRWLGNLLERTERAAYIRAGNVAEEDASRRASTNDGHEWHAAQALTDIAGRIRTLAGEGKPLPQQSPVPAAGGTSVSEAERMMLNLCEEVDAAEAHHRWIREGSHGQHVPFHGDFASANPSVMKRLRWWTREFRALLAARRGGER